MNPTSFTLSPGASQALDVSAMLSGLQMVNGLITGTLIAAKSSFGNLPDQVTIETRRNAGYYPLNELEAIAITDLTIGVNVWEKVM